MIIILLIIIYYYYIILILLSIIILLLYNYYSMCMDQTLTKFWSWAISKLSSNFIKKTFFFDVGEKR